MPRFLSPIAAPIAAELCTSARLIWPLVSACSVSPGRVDDQAVGLELGEVGLSCADAAQVVHHAGDEREGRAGLGRVVHADLALPLRAEQLLPGGRRALYLVLVVGHGRHQGNA